MTANLAPQDHAALLEQVVVAGDLSKLSPQQRLQYYRQVCESLGLNPFTRPFEYITLNGRLTLYAKRDATDQLRKVHGVSITKLERERLDDVYVVTAYATDASGRTDSAIGAVSIAGLKGDALANAMMKAETKSKRRVTLSLCGLGWLDETEIETIRDAQAVTVDHETGEVVPSPDAVACTARGCTEQIEREALYEFRGTKLLGGPLIEASTGAIGRPVCIKHYVAYLDYQRQKAQPGGE